jgi:ATP-binding cassette, subfamily C, bacterial
VSVSRWLRTSAVAEPVDTHPQSDVLRTTLRQCTAGLLLAAAVGLFISLLQLIMPLYMLQVYNRVLAGRSLDTLLMLTIIALGALMFLAMFDYIRARIFMIIGERIARRLGAITLQATVRESLRLQSAAGGGGMRDLQELRQFVTSGAATVPFDLLMTPLFITVLFTMHPAFGVVAIFAVVVLAGFGIIMDLLVRRPAALANEAALASYADVTTAIRRAEILESMGMLPAIARRWRRGQSRALRLLGAGNSGAKALGAIARSVRMALQITMLATGAVLVIKHEASAGSIMATTMIMGRLLLPFEQLIDGWRQWAHAGSALKRLRALLTEHIHDRSLVPVKAVQSSLRIDHVGFVPMGSDRPVLKGVDFTLEPGQVLGIIGPSGAGKSTLARLIVGLWRPTTGGIYLDGHDVYTWERESFGCEVGYLPQDPALLNGTIRENIARFSEAEAADVIAAAKRAGVHELIGRLPLGYETVVGDSGFVLSGGQRQRIALARALFGAPRLLVLDEPNSNMDGEGEQAFLHAVTAAKREGTTVVIIAQRMSILSIADQLLVMRAGCVERIGTRGDVVKSLTVQASPTASEPATAGPLLAFSAAQS